MSGMDMSSFFAHFIFYIVLLFRYCYVINPCTQLIASASCILDFKDVTYF